MSEQVTYRAKLKPLTPAERQPILVEIATMDEDDIDYYLFGKRIQIINSIYYWKHIEELADSDDFCNVTKNTDGSYDVLTSFYNGGTCLSEVLEENIKC
jgi:hypothetical protein